MTGCPSSWFLTGQCERAGNPEEDGHGGNGHPHHGHHRRHRHRYPLRPYPAFYPYHLYAYNPYAYFGYGYQHYGTGSCCFDEATNTIRCQNPSLDGAPAFVQQRGTYQGRRVAYVSSPAFNRWRWVWVCAGSGPRSDELAVR